MTTGWRPVVDVVGGATRLTRGLVPWRRATPRRLTRIARDVSTHWLTLAGLARVAAIRNGPDVVVIDGAGPVTAEQLDRWSATVAGELVHRGIIVPGGKLGVLCRNGRGLVVAVIAATRLGADAVVLHPGFESSQLAELLRVEDLRAVVHDEEFGDVLAAARYRGTSILADTTAPGVHSLRSMQALPQAELARPSRPGRVVVVTAGLSGRPRVARRVGTSANAGIPLTTLVRRLDLPRGAPMLIMAPLQQAFGLQFFALALGLGCPAVIVDRPDAARALAVIDEHRVATLVATPAGLAAIAEELGDRPAPASLASVVVGGGPLLASRWRRAVSRLGPIIHHIYGSAETGWCTVATPDDLTAAPGTVGRPAAGIELRIVDDEGRPVPVGGVGRLLVRSPMVADGAGNGDGAVDTGDLAHRDEAGRYFIDGRLAERIQRDGVDVFADAIEDALLAHPAVADAMVSARPDGSDLTAEVIVRSGLEEPTGEELAQLVGERLGPAPVPDAVRIVTAIATSETGRRRRIRP